jgi:hypothetical protein
VSPTVAVGLAHRRRVVGQVGVAVVAVVLGHRGRPGTDFLKYFRRKILRKNSWSF